MSTEPSKPRVRFSLRCLLVVACGCAILFASVKALQKLGLFGEVVLARLNCGKGRVIVFTADGELLEPYVPVYYTVYENGKAVSPTCFLYSFDDSDPPPKFVSVTAANGDLVGVSFAHAPRFFVIIYDFVSRNGWSGDTGSADSRGVWKRFLERRRLGLGGEAAEGIGPIRHESQ